MATFKHSSIKRMRASQRDTANSRQGQVTKKHQCGDGQYTQDVRRHYSNTDNTFVWGFVGWVDFRKSGLVWNRSWDKPCHYFLRTLSTDAASQLNVLGHDGDTLGVNGTQVSVLKESNKVGLSGFLQGKNSRSLETEIRLEVLGNLTD